MMNPASREIGRLAPAARSAEPVIGRRRVTVEHSESVGALHVCRAITPALTVLQTQQMKQLERLLAHPLLRSASSCSSNVGAPTSRCASSFPSALRAVRCNCT